MAWLILILAGLFEVVGVIGMNRIKQNRKTSSFLIFGIGIVLSFICLSYAMQSLPMGTSYAIWTGIGTVGGAAAGMAFFGESKDWRRIACIAMVLIAAIGLKLIA